ncbi:MAG: hypothetical protein J6V89_05655 [Acetobacter sp.]|nr:hypothetical protein [Acetobacter sp.]
MFYKRIVPPLAMTASLFFVACSSGGHLHHHPALDEVAVPVKPIGQKEVGQNGSTIKPIQQNALQSRLQKGKQTRKMPPILFGTPSCCL